MEEARKVFKDSVVNDMTVEKLIQMTEMGLVGKIKTTTGSTYNEQVFGQMDYLKAESLEESDAIRYECVSADGYVAASTTSTLTRSWAFTAQSMRIIQRIS